MQLGINKILNGKYAYLFWEIFYIIRKVFMFIWQHFVWLFGFIGCWMTFTGARFERWLGFWSLYFYGIFTYFCYFGVSTARSEINICFRNYQLKSLLAFCELVDKQSRVDYKQILFFEGSNFLNKYFLKASVWQKIKLFYHFNKES